MQKEQQQQQQHARQQQQLRKASADPPNHAVIAGLRTSMAQVSSMASTVSQENKLLVAENKRLVELRDQQAGVVAQLQVGCKAQEEALLCCDMLCFAHCAVLNQQALNVHRQMQSSAHAAL